MENDLPVNAPTYLIMTGLDPVIATEKKMAVSSTAMMRIGGWGLNGK
jgi:hypothetical protein